MVTTPLASNPPAANSSPVSLAKLLRLVEAPPTDRLQLQTELERCWSDDGEHIYRTATILRRNIGNLFERDTCLSDLPFSPTAKVLNAHTIAALLATWPALDNWWQERGCPAPQRRQIATDLGRQMKVCRRVANRPGLLEPQWLELIWRGGFCQVGRLQFEIQRPPAWLSCYSSEDYVLNIHIPRDGPLSPNLVDDSLKQARRFFAEAFPWLREPRYAVCDSWLLSPQVPHLAPNSNIAHFQERWYVQQTYEADGEGLFFLFDRPRDLLTSSSLSIAQAATTLTPTSHLQRSLYEHWKAGRHLQAGRGWLRLP